MYCSFRWGIRYVFVYRWQTKRVEGQALETSEFDNSEMSRTVGSWHHLLVPVHGVTQIHVLKRCRMYEISTHINNSRSNVRKLNYEEKKNIIINLRKLYCKFIYKQVYSLFNIVLIIFVVVGNCIDFVSKIDWFCQYDWLILYYHEWETSLA